MYWTAGKHDGIIPNGSDVNGYEERREKPKGN